MFSFSDKKWLTNEEVKSGVEIDNRNALGFHIPKMFDKILDIKNCYLQAEPSNSIRNEIRDFANKHGLTFFGVRNKTGLLRTLMIRSSSTGELMVLIQFFENQPENILKLMQSIQAQFKKISSVLGPVKVTVSMINAGTQHNVVPDSCKYTVDVRTIPEYTSEQILEIINDNVKAEIKVRSTRLQPSQISKEHIIVKAAEKLGIETFGSSTLSDQALLKIPSIKMGPGKSERSHTADEFIFLQEIEDGIKIYIKLLEQVLV